MRSMSRFAKLVLNIGSNYAATVVQGAIFVLLTPFVVGTLGPMAYGVWVLIRAVDFYLSYFDLGLSDALQKYVAEYDGRDDARGMERLVGTALVAQMALGLAAAAVALVGATLPTAGWFEIPAELAGDFAVLWVLTAAVQVLRFPARVLTGVYVGLQRFDVANAVDVGLGVARALGTVALLATGRGLIALAWLELGLAAASLALNGLLVGRLFPDLRARVAAPRFDTEMWQRLRAFGLWSFLDDLVTEGSAQLDRLFVPLLFSVALLAPYSLTVSLAAIVLVVSTPIADVFLPLSSELDARRDRARLARLAIEGLRACVGVAAPVAAMVAALGSAVLALWVPIDYSEISPLVLPILVTNLFFSALFWPATALLLGLGRARAVFWYSVIEVGAIAVGVVALAPFFGLTGCVVGMTVANLAAGFGLTLPAAARAVGLTLLGLLRRALVRPLLACVPGVAVAASIASLGSPASVVELALAAGAIGAVHGLSFAFLGYSADERRAYFAQIRTAAGLSA